MFARLFLAGLLLNSIVNGYKERDLVKSCFVPSSLEDCEKCVRNKLRPSPHELNHANIREQCLTELRVFAKHYLKTLLGK